MYSLTGLKINTLPGHTVSMYAQGIAIYKALPINTKINLRSWHVGSFASLLQTVLYSNKGVMFSYPLNLKVTISIKP